MWLAWIFAALTASADWALQKQQATAAKVHDFGDFAINVTYHIPTYFASNSASADDNSSSLLFWNFVQHPEDLSLRFKKPTKEITHVTADFIDTVEVLLTKPASLPTAIPTAIPGSLPTALPIASQVATTLCPETSVYIKADYPPSHPTNSQAIYTTQRSIRFGLTKDDFLRSNPSRQTAQAIPPPLIFSNRPNRRTRRESRLSAKLVHIPSLDFTPSLAFAAKNPLVFPFLFAALCLASCAWTLSSVYRRRPSRVSQSLLKEQEIGYLRTQLGVAEAKKQHAILEADIAEQEIKAWTSKGARYLRQMTALRIMFRWGNKERINKGNVIEQLDKEVSIDKSIINAKDSALAKKKQHVKTLEDKAVALQGRVETQQVTIDRHEKQVKDHDSSAKVRDLERQLKAASDANSVKDKQINKLNDTCSELKIKQKTHDADIENHKNKFRDQGKRWRNQADSIANLKSENKSLREADTFKTKTIAEQKDAVVQANSTITQMNTELASATATIKSHDDDVDELNAKLVELAAQLEARKNEARTLNERVSDKDVRIHAMQMNSSEECQKLKKEVQTYTKTIEAQLTAIKHKDDMVDELQIQVETKDASLSELRTLSSTHNLLDALHKSEKAKADRLDRRLQGLQAQLTNKILELHQARLDIGTLQQKNSELGQAVTTAAVETKTYFHSRSSQSSDSQEPQPVQLAAESPLSILEATGEIVPEETEAAEEDFNALAHSTSLSPPLQNGLTAKEKHSLSGSDLDGGSESENTRTIGDNDMVFAPDQTIDSKPERNVTNEEARPLVDSEACISEQKTAQTAEINETSVAPSIKRRPTRQEKRDFNQKRIEEGVNNLARLPPRAPGYKSNKNVPGAPKGPRADREKSKKPVRTLAQSKWAAQ